MSDDPRFDHAAREWIAAGPGVAPAGAVAAAMARVVSMERAPRRVWRGGVRLAVATLVAIIAVGGFATAGARLPAPMQAGPSPTSRISTPAPTGPCADQLIPSLLLTNGCTYASREFAHPFTVRGDGRWISGGESATGAQFGGFLVDVGVTLIVLGQVETPLACGSSAPPSTPDPLPRSAAEYLGWLESVVAAPLSTTETTLGGLTATRVDNAKRSRDCAPFFVPDPVGSSAVANDGTAWVARCDGVCAVYVLDHRGDVLVVAGRTGMSSSVAADDALAPFLEGLQFLE